MEALVRRPRPPAGPLREVGTEGPVHEQVDMGEELPGARRPAGAQVLDEVAGEGHDRQAALPRAQGEASRTIAEAASLVAGVVYELPRIEPFKIEAGAGLET